MKAKRAEPSFQIAWGPDDVLADQAIEQAARAMAKWLQGSVNVQRSINTLTLPEMKNLAAAGIHAWIKERSKQSETPPPNQVLM